MSDELLRSAMDEVRRECRQIIIDVGPEDDAWKDEALTRLDELQEIYPSMIEAARREHVEAPSAPPASAGGEVIEANIATVAAYECGLEDGQRKERARVERELSRLERLLAARAAKG